MRRDLSPPQSEIDFSFGEDNNTDNDLNTRLSYIVYTLGKMTNPYVGNKRKMIIHIIKSLKKHNVGFKTVLDLFSGSSSVSIAFKMLDSKVRSNDLLLSAYINALAYVVNKDTSLSEKDKDTLCNIEKLKEPYPFFEKYKDRFTDKEQLFITNFSHNIKTNFYGDIIKTAIASVVLQNHIIEHCFVGGRLNSGQILAKLDHRINHSKNKGSGMPTTAGKINWITPIYTQDTNTHSANNMDSVCFLDYVDSIDELIYIDPPYGGEQSDYSHMFYFFEELLSQNNVFIEYYKSPEDRMKYLNSFCNRFSNSKDYEKGFDELIFRASKYPNIAVSYNDSSWGTIDEICKVIKRYRKSVIVEEFSYAYKYRENKESAKEYLIISKE